MARAGSSPAMARASFSSEDDGRSVYSAYTAVAGGSPQIGVALGSPCVGFEGFAQAGFGASDVSLVGGGADGGRVVFEGRGRVASIKKERAPSPALQPVPQFSPQVPVMARSIAMQRQREHQGDGATRYLTPDLGYSRFGFGSRSRSGSRSGSGSGSGFGHGDDYETATEGTHVAYQAERGNASLRSSGSSWSKRVYGVFRSEEPVTPEIGFGGFGERAE